jgi:hypothetical protein
MTTKIVDNSFDCNLDFKDHSQEAPSPLRFGGSTDPSGPKTKTGEGHRVKQKILKSKGNIGNLVLVEEVDLSQVVHMANQTLVGRASGRTFALKTLIE